MDLFSQAREINTEVGLPKMDEATLIEKLLKIEALFSGAATEGERACAGLTEEETQ